MVRREIFINKIRDLGFKYKSTQKRTYLYRQSGTTKYIPVPMADWIDDEFVIWALRYACVPPNEIQSFLSSAKS